jgi:hypothetical protein
VIELDGLEAGSAARLRDVPGVVSAEGGTVRTSAGRSDEVLRHVLAWDGVHVLSVRAGEAGSARAGDEAP